MPAKKKPAKKKTAGKKKVAKKSAAKKPAPKKAVPKKKSAAKKATATKAAGKKAAGKKAAGKKAAGKKPAATKTAPKQAAIKKSTGTKTAGAAPRKAAQRVATAAAEISRVADGAPVVSMAAALGAPEHPATRGARGAAEGRARAATAADDPAVGLAQVVAALALDKKATDVVLLKVTDLTSYTDVFVCASAPSERQVQAIARHADDELRKAGKHPIGVEGMDQGRWVLVDFGSVVLHVFLESARPQYDLEGFWSEAPRLEVDEAEGLAVLQSMRAAREAQLAAAASE